MYKIEYTWLSREIIANFIIGYKNIYKNLYFDTWIIWVDEIISCYIKKWNEIEKEISCLISDKLSKETIFWYKLYEDRQKSVKIFLKSFMLEIFYEEDLDEKIRFIENIKINKK